VVGKAINEWEALRPQQPRLLDPKTNELVDFLFAYRGRQIAPSYINTVLIPLLCDRAGIPASDEQGAITSHRARATIATLLLNAPEGMNIWEMMQWLGHHNVNSTQHYVRRKQQRVAVAYTKAERNSMLIETLVETKADAHGNIKVYYVLGDDGLCSNPEWATCIYRLACRKCPFFIAKEQAQQIRSREGIKRFLEVVELTEEEKRAAEVDAQKIAENIEHTAQFPPPDGLHQRPKGEKARYIPLQVLDASSLPKT
jgi:nicotinic acid mononucleotide adenylyltransferase